MARHILRGLCAGLLFLPAVPFSNAAAPRSVAVLAGGCYWGVESVYRHVNGVDSAVSGFALGQGEPRPAETGEDEIAEAVQIEYDSTRISYRQLLEIFFSVVHDPTQGDRQGPDVGHRYRSAIYTMNDAQRKAAEAYVAGLRKAGTWPKPITTVVYPLRQFSAAPSDQQDFARRHPNMPYIQMNDVPKIAALKTRFAALYREE